MKITNVIKITKKEISGFLDNPASYISLIVFLVLWEFLFFRNVFLVGEANLRMLFDYLPWLLMFFAPAITMGSFAQEKSDGTLELVLTHPVKETEVILGKFKSALIYITVAILFSLPVAVTLSFFGPLDWGVYFSQVLAGVFLSAAFISVGLFISSYLGSQIAALLVTAGVSFFLVISGSDFFTANLPLITVPFFERLSVATHVSSMSRGVIDLRDVWYFISVTSVFLLLTYRELLKRKYGNRKDYYRTVQTGVYLLIAIAVLSNVISARIPGRLDLTGGKIYSLSQATRKTLSDLNDIVTVTLYASGKLPNQLIPVVRDVKDTLADYKSEAKGNLTVVIKDPSDNPEISQEASQRGVKEVQFNVIGSEEFQLKTGFLGLVVSYGDKHEAIPFIQDTSDLEYQLTSLILELTQKEKKTVAFLSGDGEKSLTADYTVLDKEISRQFDTQTVTVDPGSEKVATDASILVIAGATQDLPENTIKAVEKFTNEGKPLFIMDDSFNVNPQSLNPEKVTNNLSEITGKTGLSVADNIVYDLKSYETVRTGQSFVMTFLPYPFWIRSLPNPGSPLTSRLESVVLPWASSININKDVLSKSGYQETELLTTTQYSGTAGENSVLIPGQENYPQDNLKTNVMSVYLVPKDKSGTKGGLVLVGDSDFLSDQFVQNSPGNLAFGLSVISNLTQETSLAGIKVKEAGGRNLVFGSSLEPTMIKYGNMAVAIVIPLALAVVRLLRRKRMKNLVYTRQTV